MTRALRPAWLIAYEGKDVSVDIADMVTSVTYTDHLQGKSDELELVIEDTEGLWRSGWYPATGDRFEAKIGFERQPLMACGRFEVDSIDLAGPPDTLTIRGLAAGNSSPLRTTQSRAFEGLGIDGIVRKVAAEYGYEIVGDIAQGAKLARVSQSNETTLAFLRRIAESYGFVFSMRGDKLIFCSLLALEQAPTISTIDRSDLKSYTFKNSAQKTYVACEVTFHDPSSGKLTKARVEAENVRPKSNTASAPLPTATIRVGAHGDQVRDWQRFLAGQSLYAASVDGAFGAITDRGTRSFQRAHPPLKVDGAVGKQTYTEAARLGFVATSGDVGSGTSGDVLRKEIRCESIADAETKARALLRQANRLKSTGSLELPGNQLLVAGAKIDLTGMARLSGQYTVDKSAHAMTRSGGYSTNLEVAYV